MLGLGLGLDYVVYGGVNSIPPAMVWGTATIYNWGTTTIETWG